MAFGIQRLDYDEQDGASMGQVGIVKLDKNYTFAKGEFCAIQMFAVTTNTIGVTAKSNIGEDLALDGVYDPADPSFYEGQGGRTIWGNFSEVQLEYVSSQNAATTYLLLYPISYTLPLPSTLTYSKSLHFDPSRESRLRTSNSFQSVFQDSFTISAWIKPDDGQPSAPQSIFSTQAADADSGSGFIKFELLANGKMYFGHDIDGDTDADRTSTDAFSDGAVSNWKHVALVFTKSSSTQVRLQWYINGVPETQLVKNSHAAADYTNTEIVHIGCQNTAGTLDAFFDGKIDEVSLWSKALTTYEIQRFINDLDYDASDGIRPMDLSQHPTFSTHCQGWWRMGDGTLDDANVNDNGLIADQVNSTLGSGIITGNNSTFDSGQGDWAAYTAATVDAVDGALKIVKSGTGTLDVRAKLEFSSTFDTYPVGTVWKLSWDMWKDEGLTSTTFEMSMAGGSGSVGTTIMASSPVSTTRQSYSGYFPQHNSGDIITNCNMANGVGESPEIGYYIDNITLKKVNGNPAVMEKFLTSQMVDDVP